MQTNLDGMADTSLETFQEIKDDLVCDREQVYDAIQCFGRVTLKELCVRLNRHPNDISGRITELVSNGRIVIVGKKLLPNSRGRMTSNRVYEVVGL